MSWLLWILVIMVVVILLIVFAKKGVFGATLAGVAESIVDAADVDDHLD